MDKTLEDTAGDTIELLEARLKRIEYVLKGQLDDKIKTTDSRPAFQKLNDLEQALNKLAAKSRVVQDVLNLHAQYPDLFYSQPAEDTPSSLNTTSIASIIFAAASSYPLTASSLTSILDTPIPSTDLSSELLKTKPKVAELATIQALQDREVSYLKERSSALLQRWHSVDVLQAGEYWADVEGRVEAAEQTIRQAESARDSNKGII